MDIPAPSSSRFKIPTASNDTKSEWLNVARRMQGAAQSRGASVIVIRVLVDAGGEPMLWLEPEVIHVEPAGRSEQVLKTFLGLKD